MQSAIPKFMLDSHIALFVYIVGWGSGMHTAPSSPILSRFGSPVCTALHFWVVQQKRVGLHASTAATWTWESLLTQQMVPGFQLYDPTVLWSCVKLSLKMQLWECVRSNITLNFLPYFIVIKLFTSTFTLVQSCISDRGAHLNLHWQSRPCSIIHWKHLEWLTTRSEIWDWIT